MTLDSHDIRTTVRDSVADSLRRNSHHLPLIFINSGAQMSSLENRDVQTMQFQNAL